MKKQKKLARARVVALTLAVLIVTAITVLPAFAFGNSRGNNNMRGRIGGRTGETTDTSSIGEGIESAVDDVTGGIESAVDDLTDIPNGTATTHDGTGNVTDDMTGDTTDGGLMGDETPQDGTNIPDTDIGGAVEDNDHDGISDPVDSDDDNDGILDPADTDADGDGRADDSKTAGIIGIVVAVIIVIAIIVLVIAVMPRGRNKK